MILSPECLDRTIARARLVLIAGLVAAALEWWLGIGAVCAIALVSLGALLRSVQDYRIEPGLWMLALLFGSLFLVVNLTIEIGLVTDVLRGMQVPWQATLDIAIALHIQWLAVRVMATVVVHNRRVRAT